MSLLAQLRAAGDDAAAVRVLLHQYAPQLLQLEQQIATTDAAGLSALDAETRDLSAWVRNYTVRHEIDHVAVKDVSADEATDAPAPLFFYFLHHEAQALCLTFLSALYTDPTTDQSFYWLNDPAAFVAQMQAKVQRTKDENRRMVQTYATTKKIDTALLATHVALFSGVCAVLESLLATRARALATQLPMVRTALVDVRRQKLAVEWQHWLASSTTRGGGGGGALRAIDEALAGSDTHSWHRMVAERRAHRASSHARTFRPFLARVRARDADLAAQLVDEEYSEEAELHVDRLWCLATGTAQANGHIDDAQQQQAANGISGDKQPQASQLAWSYPPPSVHSLLEIFFLPDDEQSQTSQQANNYKAWLLYYFLLEFESRRDASNASTTPSPSLSSECARLAGLTTQQCALVKGMVHMDAAYDVDASTLYQQQSPKADGVLSPTCHASFTRALACFSSDYSYLLAQADFPMVASILASVLVLRQWSAGVTFFQNCFVANSAASVAHAAYTSRQRAIARYNAPRQPDQHAPFEPRPAHAMPNEIVFYSTLHHVLYVHVLLQKELYFEAIQFIRAQAEDANTAVVGVSDPTSSSKGAVVNTPLQLTLWHYWNLCLLDQRKYHVLLKQVALGAIEEEIVLAYWKQHIGTPVSTAVDASTSKTPSLSPADLIILYHFEHYAIVRGLRFYYAHMRARAKSSSSSLSLPALKVPQEMIAAYAKLVQYDEAAYEEDQAEGLNTSDDEHELDLAHIQLRGLRVTFARQQAKHTTLLAQILASEVAGTTRDDDAMATSDAEMHMLDVARPGSELNPFAPHNVRVRERAEKEAAAQAAAAAAQAQAAAQQAAAVAAAQAKAAAAARAVATSPAKKAASEPTPAVTETKAAEPAPVVSPPRPLAPSTSSPPLTSSLPPATERPKSPEKTPRVQKVSASLSAAKSKRAAAKERQEQAEREEAAATAALEAATKEAAASTNGMADDEDLEPAASFPSFAAASAVGPTSSTLTPSTPQRTVSNASAASTPTPGTPLTRASSGVSTVSRKSAVKQAPVVAFSDMDASTTAVDGTAPNAAAFVLPAPEPETQPEAEAASAPTTVGVAATPRPKRTASLRASAALAAAAASGSKPVATPNKEYAPLLSSAAAPSVNLPDASTFAPSFLAPATPASSARLKSSRKRPLASLPTLPLVSTTSVPIPASPTPATARMTMALTDGGSGSGNTLSSRATRQSSMFLSGATGERRTTRATRSSKQEMSDDESHAAGDDEQEDESMTAPPSSSRASKLPRAKPTTRRTGSNAPNPEDVPEIVSTRASTRRMPLSTSSSPAPSPVPNPFQQQRASGATSRRPPRTGPIFIDESLLLAAGDSNENGGATIEEEEPAVETEEAAPKRGGRSTRSSRATSKLDSAEPSPAASANNSPTRPTRTATTTRVTRTRSAGVPPTSEAPTPARRSTRHTDAAATAADEEAPTVRTTRSKAGK